MIEEVKPEKKAYVYFLQAVGGGPIKIGLGTDVPKRFKQHQSGNPEPLRILHTIEFPNRQVAHAHEADLHQEFARWRLHGEWFEPSEPVARVCNAEEEPRSLMRAALQRAYAQGYQDALQQEAA